MDLFNEVKLIMIFIIFALPIVLLLQGVLAVACTKEKQQLLPVFMAAITINVKYLKERIDFDRFIGLIHKSNLIFSCIALALALITCCLK